MKILLGIVVAIVSLKWWPEIPSLSVIAPVVVILFLLRKCLPALAMGLTLGGLIAYSAAGLFLFKTNTALTVAHDTTIEGKVGSLFTAQKQQTNVIFDVDTVGGQKLNAFERFRTRIYWRFDEQPKQGERWRITVRLREPYGRVNEAGFDAEVYFLSKHIHAKGSLKSAERVNEAYSFRQHLVDNVIRQTEGLPSARFLVALTFGERGLLSSEDWQGLRNTGLGHLLAISGLHIGLAFLFGCTVTKLCAPFVFRHDQHLWFPLLVGMMLAIFYAWMAGFSLTSQRALLALLVASVIRLLCARFQVFEALLIVLAVVLVIDPLSVFSVSFWLSFSAVTILCVAVFFAKGSAISDDSAVHQINAVHRSNTAIKENKLFDSEKSKRRFYAVKQLVRMQAYLVVGMLPITWLWFGGISFPAFALNLVAVPLVSFVTVPAILAALFFSLFGLASVFWYIADASLWPVMAFLASFESGWYAPSEMPVLVPVYIWTLALIMLMTRLRSLLVLKLSLFAGLVFCFGQENDNQTWRVDVLDVGHGLSVLIEKQGQAIVYDTGSAWTNGSMAQWVLAPILEKRGLSLSGFIVSHSDNDHAGGEEWIIEQLSPVWVRSPERKNGYFPCREGEQWYWQGLSFSALSPTQLVSQAENEDSCVVRVSDGTHSVLLTGDVPLKEELLMLKRNATLASTVLLVPHHGSKSSSSVAFLDAVKPEVAIASAGRYTPWNLPHPSVVERYRNLGISWVDTIEYGQISVYFSDKGWRLSSQRMHEEPFWYRKMFGAPTRKE
ncbi:DNA internalization-related competence protein ComEC/Rec2 [Enterovibrio nigricans]|uniref:Competence protein ComEC n=1 Tax=Enterovibrio nigricans DSM 22720 TaxID=1121868 RepID=A0A1T4UPV2_9GAMM|nr:DNA internalization-related competence protein ComEC/Rec2 [Enterovibrio nigricans]PKF51046.1 DNA internalization-related competence protein ComEC/Rec2 [Enterovibrio nigricans]SKA54772.1 competence protein ComEC [Enterovibrio nigricans DSM 22720]